MFTILILNIFTFLSCLSYKINRKWKRVNLKPGTCHGYFEENPSGQLSQQLDETCLPITWQECSSSRKCNTQYDYVYYILDYTDIL